MKVPNKEEHVPGREISLSRLQNEGSQLLVLVDVGVVKSIKATE